MSNDNFKRYAEIKKTIAELEDQADELKPAILDQLKFMTSDMEEKNLKFDFGTFSVTTRKVWEYSEKIVAMEQGIKKIKKMEEENGQAKATIIESLRYQE